MSALAARRAWYAGAVLCALLVAVVAANSTQWIGRTFPGFFVMANRVVPSIALPGWEEARSETIFQHQVVMLDGRPVTSADDVYAAVAAAPPGTLHHYVVRAPGGAETTVAARARTLSGREYALIFGAYLSTGIAFFLTGFVVVWLKRSAASLALLVQCLVTGVFVVTAADLYGPHWFFRVHVVAESLLAAGFIHLALVFPTDRLGLRRGRTLAAVYAPFLVLAAAYQFSLGSAAAYTRTHLLASASHGVGALAIIAAVAWDLATTRSPLVRRRIGVVGLGVFGAFALPGGLMAASAVFGGQVALNAGAFTAFVFPLSLGYAIVKQDLFEIDVMLRRAATYAVALLAITATYFAAFALVGALMPLQSLSFVTMAVLNLAILLSIAPIKARAQDAVDRFFFRQDYDAELVLSELSQTLSSARAMADVERHTRRVVTAALHPETACLWTTDDGITLRAASSSADAGLAIVLPAAFARRFAGASVTVCSRWQDEADETLAAFWRTIDAEILVPIRSRALVIGTLTLGRKESGRSYNQRDIAFLAAAASQVGLAMTNASAFGKLAELNANLEDQVRDRTAALEVANRDLERSYNAAQSAFRQLEQSQTSLMRADRLSTLGRLAASVAHEVNTPLGAVLNALDVLGKLGREYHDSIADETVSPDDHREIADEIVATAGAAAGWARKAAAFISRVKTHGREPHPDVQQSFTIAAVVDETRALLAQRLRLECCTLDFAAEPPDIVLVGDPARLGQVLVNLVNNALDAYEERHSTESRIAVSARRVDGVVEIAVEDWAGGMPPEVADRIFDELFTTKDAGRGTGLGLSIARNVVEESFDGRLTVATTPGSGSRFLLTIPIGDAPTQAAAAEAC